MVGSQENDKFDLGVKGLNQTLKGNDHQQKKFLNMQLSPVSSKGIKNSMDNMHTVVSYGNKCQKRKERRETSSA